MNQGKACRKQEKKFFRLCLSESLIETVQGINAWLLMLVRFKFAGLD
jgi:hypothetical protein